MAFKREISKRQMGFLGTLFRQKAGARFLGRSRVFSLALVPLWWVDLYDKIPQDLSRIKGVAFSPTLVVMHHGKEAERIFGYSGDAFFWGLARRDIEKIGFLDPVGHPTN